MSSACETGAGMYYKSPIIATQTIKPFCIPAECKTPVLLQKGHVYGVNAPITMVDPAAMDNLYRPWKLGDGWAHSALLTCEVDATQWKEDCERYAVKNPGDCNWLLMDCIGWPEGINEAELTKVRATSGCCWIWRATAKPNTKTPCPVKCVDRPAEVEEVK